MSPHQGATTKRCEVHYRGQVQGVGFRYTVQRLAEGFRVTGFVRNLPDGRVQLVAEGESGEVSRFLDAVADRMSGYIREAAIEGRSATGEFRQFEIRY
jgi:acylphosphatase